LSSPAVLCPQFDPVIIPPPSGRYESAWWALLLGHAAALDTFYGRIQKAHRLTVTLDMIQEESFRALARLSGRSYAVLARGYGKGAGHDAAIAMGCEIGWWSEAARASFALAAVLGLHETPHPDAALACEVHRKVRMGVFLMVPDSASGKILLRATGDPSLEFLQAVAIRQLAVEGGDCVR